MKRNLNSRVLAMLCILATLAIGCGGKDDDVVTKSCETDISKFQEALTAYSSDVTNNSKCLAFKAAADDLLDCPGITASQRAEYQNAVAGLTCQ